MLQDDWRVGVKAQLWKLGVTQYRFAAMLGITPQYLCDVLKGKRIPGSKLKENIDTALTALENSQRRENEAKEHV